MILLSLAWTLLTASCVESGSSQMLLQEPVKVLYPEILTAVTIDCECFNTSCVSVYWFRSTLTKVEYLAKCNNADRAVYGSADEKRFKFNKRGSMFFVLRILNVREADAGMYSCVVKDNDKNELWRPGVLLRPGEIPPTLPPIKPKPPVKSVCRCSAKNHPADGCGSLVLWPLVGLIAGLALALVCTLYYFSRLPKKCRHHFVKKR